MRNLTIAALVVVCSCLFFSGCSEAPQRTVDEIKSVLDEAKGYSADVYCKETFDSAQFSYNQALSVILDMDKKLPFFRDYSQAVTFLSESKEIALRAKANVESGKGKLRTEVDQLIRVSNPLLDSVGVRIEDAKSKGMNVISWTKDIDSARVMLTEAARLLGGGDVISSRTKVLLANSKISSVKQDIDVLVAPTGR